MLSSSMTIENIVTQMKECIMLIRDNCLNCNISICSVPPHKIRSDINKTIYEAICKLAYLCDDIGCTFIYQAQGHGTDILSTYIKLTYDLSK